MYALIVNGERVEVAAGGAQTLANYLRDTCRTKSVHVGCEEGVCGACTVLVDGAPMRACLVLAQQLDGANVMTAEGVAGDPLGQRLQDCLVDHHAAQCGYCTSGMLLTSLSFLHQLGADVADESRVRAALSSVACRCTGYASVVAAVGEAAAAGAIIRANPPSSGAAVAASGQRDE